MISRELSTNWQDPSRYLKKIYIERSCADDAYGNEIIARAGLPAIVVDEYDLSELVDGTYPENLSKGKQILLLCENRGKFLKECPSTRVYRCCDYKVVNIGMGCPMDCTYCILQAYLNKPHQVFFINKTDLFNELEREIGTDSSAISRIGTGEFTDSMALDRITGLSRDLIQFFAGRKNSLLELKTKSTYIDNVKDLDHGRRTVMAWSLNSEKVVNEEEFRASSIDERLEAAALCESWGYHLAFHFDPIVAYTGWQKGYKNTIDKLFSKIRASSIKWISLGGFRYIPKLKQIGIARFPRTNIYHHEFIEGLDSKQRYFRPLRVELYKYIYTLLKQYSDERTCIYFCMESDEVWQEVMGFTPDKYGGVPQMLDNTVKDWE